MSAQQATLPSDEPAPVNDQPADGYWLIEPDPLSPLMASRALHPLAGTVLNWLATEVSGRLGLASKAVLLEVIQAEYLGTYPCLAAKGLGHAIPPDVADQIEREITHLLEKTSLVDFVQRVAANPLRRAS